MAYATPAMMKEVHAKLAADQHAKLAADQHAKLAADQHATFASASASSSSSSSASRSVIPAATAAIASSGASNPPRQAKMSNRVFVYPASASATPAAAAALPASSSLDLPVDTELMSQSMILPANKTQQVAAAPLRSRDDAYVVAAPALPAYRWQQPSSASVVILPSQKSKKITLQQVFTQAKKSISQELAKKNASSQTLCNALTELNESCVKAITASGFQLTDPSYASQHAGQFGLVWLVMVEPMSGNPTTWQVAANWKNDLSPFASSDSLRAALHINFWRAVTVTCTCQFTKPNPADPEKVIRDERVQTFTVFPGGAII